MNDKSRRRQQMFEAFEVSGRGRDDASESSPHSFDALLAARPELAAPYERNKQLDDVLGRVFRDVPVPEGLQERILARLEDAGSVEHPAKGRPGLSEAVAQSAANRSCISPSPGRPTPLGSRSSRRRWIAASAGVAAASVLLAGVLCLQMFSKEYSSAEVLDEAVNRFAAADATPAEPVSAEILASYPPSKEVRRLSGTRCRNVDDFLGRRAVAYEMAAWEGTRATLFVAPRGRPIAGLDARPPYCPHQATGGRVAGAWQADGVLYVLVVQGDQRAYRRFLEPGDPLT